MSQDTNTKEGREERRTSIPDTKKGRKEKGSLSHHTSRLLLEGRTLKDLQRGNIQSREERFVNLVKQDPG